LIGKECHRGTGPPSAVIRAADFQTKLRGEVFPGLKAKACRDGRVVPVKSRRSSWELKGQPACSHVRVIERRAAEMALRSSETRSVPFWENSVRWHEATDEKRCDRGGPRSPYLKTVGMGQEKTGGPGPFSIVYESGADWEKKMMGTIVKSSRRRFVPGKSERSCADADAAGIFEVLMTTSSPAGGGKTAPDVEPSAIVTTA